MTQLGDMACKSLLDVLKSSNKELSRIFTSFNFLALICLVVTGKLSSYFYIGGFPSHYSCLSLCKIVMTSVYYFRSGNQSLLSYFLPLYAYSLACLIKGSPLI